MTNREAADIIKLMLNHVVFPRGCGKTLTLMKHHEAILKAISVLEENKEMKPLVIFTDEDLDNMLNHHGVIHMKANNGQDFEFMSEKQYERMHPKDPKCPYRNVLKKNSDICGLMEFCNSCEWWKDFIQR